MPVWDLYHTRGLYPHPPPCGIHLDMPMAIDMQPCKQAFSHFEDCAISISSEIFFNAILLFNIQVNQTSVAETIHYTIFYSSSEADFGAIATDSLKEVGNDTQGVADRERLKVHDTRVRSCKLSGRDGEAAHDGLSCLSQSHLQRVRIVPGSERAAFIGIACVHRPH